MTFIIPVSGASKNLIHAPSTENILMKHPLRRVLSLLPVAGLALVADLRAADDGIQHQFGPTGIFGNEAERVITVTRVDEGSPAHDKIDPGMEIIGTGVAEFKTRVRRELAAGKR
jgi:hypothetical protein